MVFFGNAILQAAQKNPQMFEKDLKNVETVNAISKTQEKLKS